MIREQVYYKNNEMREMDDHFGDLHGIISGKRERHRTSAASSTGMVKCSILVLGLTKTAS